MTNHHRGIIFMLLSAVIFALMAALVRGVHVNPYTMVMVRFLIGTGVCLGIFATGRDRPRWTSWGWLLGRGIIGGIAVILLYWSIQHVGLGKAQMLSYTYVIFASVMAVPVLGERLKPLQWLMVVVAMAGVVLLCDVQKLAFHASDGVALLSGFCSAIAVICVTKCRATDTSTNIFWSQSVFGAAIAVWPTATHWQSPQPVQWLWLLAIGLTAAAGQLSMTYAYKHTGASQGSLLSLITPVLGTLTGVLYFHEHFSGGFVIGAAMILGACAYMAVNPVAQAQKTPPAGE